MFTLKKTHFRCIARFTFIIVAALVLLAQASTLGAAATVSDDSLISLTLPGKIPFTLVLPNCGADGFIQSDTFRISNNGPTPILVTLESVRLKIEDSDLFAIVDEEPLPEHGNSLYMLLVCTQNEVSTEYVITAESKTAHTYLLEPGESAYFRFAGTVSQRGGSYWGDTQKTVFIRFTAMSIDEEPHPEPSGELDDPEQLEPGDTTPDDTGNGADAYENDGSGAEADESGQVELPETTNDPNGSYDDG
jgi:hypothetical protein